MSDEEDVRVIEEYVKSFKKADIDEFMEYLVNQKIIFNAWFKDKDDNRVTYKLVVEGGINPVEPEIKFICHPTSPELDFLKLPEEKQTLYIHTDSKKYVCEVQIVYKGDKHLFIIPPDELFVKEQRRVPRIILKPGEKEVHFKKDNKEYDFSLLDISKTGMAFVVQSRHAKVFSYAKDNIQIFKIFGNQLESSILGSIVYIKKIAESTGYRVGVQFYDEIDIAAYE